MNCQTSTKPSTVPKQRTARRTQAMVLALLSLLILFHLLNNGLWLATNQVVYGADRMYHHTFSLDYYDLLRGGVSLRSLFAALTLSGYYPPLVHLTVVGFYELFGVSMDVAAISTSFYLVLLLLAVYGLGERLAGQRVGLLSAVIVSTFPIVFSMSRYLYVDLALTAMVALNICLLLRSDRFRRKGYALLYGLSLGLGLLTKWTFIVFIAAPSLLMLASPGVLSAAWHTLQPTAWNGRRLLVACLLGLGLTAVWFVPNVATTAELPLGYLLVPLSWLLWSGTWYFLLAPSERGANLLAALGLGLSVAASWYLTRIDFVPTFWQNAYGKPTGQSWGFGPYLDFLYREQLSPIYAILLVVAALGLIWSYGIPKLFRGGIPRLFRDWQHTRSCRRVAPRGPLPGRWHKALTPEAAGRGAESRSRSGGGSPPEGWALVLWVAVSYFIFSSRVSIVHSRYIMPLLPPLGIAIALWLSRLRPAWVRVLVTCLVLAGALVQFAALSFDALAGLQERVPFLANGLSIQLPATGQNDPGYWVLPDILQYAEEHRGSDTAQLGVLVNKPQVNSKHFFHLAYTDYPHIQTKELAIVGWTPPAYPRLFECDFVLLISPLPDYTRRPDTIATLQRLLDTPDDTFHRAFELAETYPLPDGPRLLLYQRRFALPPDTDLAYYEALMADLGGVAGPGDGAILVPPEQVYALARYGDGSLPLYPLPPEPRPASELDTAALAQLGAEHSRLWVILGDTHKADPAGLVARWLADHFYRAHDAWYGPVQLALYAPAPVGAQSPEAVPGGFPGPQATWQGGIALQGYRALDRSLPLGQILRLELQWQASEPIAERYKVFVHLVNEGGQVVAQRDSEPLAGTYPTTEWQPGGLITDRYGLWLPSDLPPGDYQLLLGLYHPESGERLPACCPASDAISLAGIRVEGEVASILTPDGN